MPMVLDPVLASSDGTPLLSPAGVAALGRRLVPRATVLTPNWPEAAVLLGTPVADDAQADVAARRLGRLTSGAIVLTGGHGEGGVVRNRLLEEGRLTYVDADRLKGRFHGTGCALSSALAVGLARGAGVVEALEDAVCFVSKAMASAKRFGPGASILDL